MTALVAVLAVLPPLGGRPQPLSHPPLPIRWHSAIASWYDDEGETACGVHYPDGVANLELPCGTTVRLCFRGCVDARVQDRGPYVDGRTFDLNATTKAAISCTDLCGSEGGNFTWTTSPRATLARRING